MIKAIDIVVGYEAARRLPSRYASRPNRVNARRGPSLQPGIPIAGPLSFSYADGECVMLRGRNGSGKTTLMKTLAGLLPPI